MMEDDVNVNMHWHAQVSDNLPKEVHQAEDQPREAEKEQQQLLIHDGLANHDPDVSNVFVNTFIKPAHSDLNFGDLSIPFSSSADNKDSASEEKNHYSTEHDRDDVDIELKAEDQIQVEMYSEDCNGGSVMSIELVEEGIPENEISNSTSSNESKQFVLVGAEIDGQRSESVSATDVKESQELEILVGADVQNRLAEQKELNENVEGPESDSLSVTEGKEAHELKNSAVAVLQNDFREENDTCVDVDEVNIESKPRTKSESPEDDLDEDSCFAADTKPQKFKNTASAVVQNGLGEEKDLHEDGVEIPIESKQWTEPERLGEDACEDSCFANDAKIDAIVSNGVVSNESNNDALTTGCIQEAGSTDVKSDEIADEHDITFECIGSGLGSIDSNQDASQQDGSIESDKTASVPVIGDNALIESVKYGTNVEKIKSCENSVCVVTDDNMEIESGELAAERSEITDSSPAHDAKLEIEPENVLVVDKDKPDLLPDHALTDGSAFSFNHDEEMDVESHANSSTENGSNSPSGSVADAKVEIEPESVLLVDKDEPTLPPDHPLTDGTAISIDHGNETDVESHVNSSTENGSSLHSGSVADVKLVHEGEHLSSLSSCDMPGNGNVTSNTNDNAKAVESATSVNNLVKKEEGSQFIRFGGTQVEVFSGLHAGENPTPTQEGSIVDMDQQNMGEEVVRRPFNYLIRLPRCDNENIKEQIKYAKGRLDEENKKREAIQAEIQIQRATCIECNQDVESAKSAEKAAWEMLKAKRQEMDSVQSIMARLNTAISVEDIDVQIRNMEHTIEHETLALKEEKQLLRQIKQLKQHREELSSNMGKQDRLQPSQDYKDRIEEHVKHLQLLRKEMESLRQVVRKAEAVTQAAKKKHDEECNKLGESRARYRAADEIRQEAYAKLKTLKEELYEKTKYFWDHKNAVNIANELAAEGKIEEMQRICFDQVEKMMELWNKNDEFRRDYVRCNIRSTLRRLRTMDGRSLGPDEEPPAIPNLFNERATKNNSLFSLRSTVEQEKKAVPAETVNKQDEPDSKVGVQSSQTTKIKKPAKAAPLAKSLVMVSSRDEAEDVKEEEPLKTKEEEEEIRKAEEMRMEEEAARLKEKLRLEEMAKAKEAMERKKRNADKAQQRAALRAQKEAEQKEKEREKRARKKERRKAAAAVDALGHTGGVESAPSSEIQTPSMEECEQTEEPVEATKRLQKPSQFTKQTKAKAIPPPLRNREKRRMQSWMWALVTILVVIALFILGNSGFSSSSGLQGFGF